MSTAAKRFLLKSMAYASGILRRTPLARSRLLNRIQSNLAQWLHGSTRARVGPFEVQFHPDDRVLSKRLILYGGYEKEEIALLCSLVKEGDHVLDVGANVGIHTMFLSRAVGSRGRVIAVEPDPVNASLLTANLEHNGCDNVTIARCALGNSTGTVQLFQVPTHRANASLADITGHGESVDVPLRTGEDVLAQFDCSPHLVKVDVEGCEPQVLSGLGCKPKYVVFEFVPRQLEALGNDPLDFLKEMKTLGYDLELVDPDSGERQALAPETILNVAVRGNRVYNILAVRP